MTSTGRRSALARVRQNSKAVSDCIHSKNIVMLLENFLTISRQGMIKTSRITCLITVLVYTSITVQGIVRLVTMN